MENWERITKLCCSTEPERKVTSGDDARSTVRRLKEAEFLAVESFEWAEIADAWLAFFGKDGLQNAIRCAQKSATPSSRFCCGWLAGAESWGRIAKYDDQYLAQAVVWMQRAEDDIEYCGEACCCAYSWILLSLEQSQSHAFRLMRIAEEYCGGDERSREDLGKYWVRCFGEKVGGDNARRFMARTRIRDDGLMQPLRVAICSPVEKSIGQVVNAVVKKAVMPIRAVEAYELSLDDKMLALIGSLDLALVVIVFNPHWPGWPPGGQSMEKDRETLRHLRVQTRGLIIALHNGQGGHGDADLRQSGADLVLALPFEPEVLRTFVARRLMGMP